MAKRMRRRSRKGGKRSFAKRVQKVIDRSLKNTVTNYQKSTQAVCTQNDFPGSPKQWFLWAPGLATFARTNGGSTLFPNQYPMEGDSLKIKKWWIKGSIEYNDTLAVGYSLDQSAVGYVDIYLCRQLLNGLTMSSQLQGWYMNGTDQGAPTGSRDEMLYPLNRNRYKIYARRRYKMGTAYARQDGVPAVAVNEANNDFDYARNFSFDVTRFVAKNRRIRFQGTEETANDATLRSLSLVAIFHPACGNLGSPPSTVTPGFDFQTCFNIHAISWGEYETA